jgi:hypothetical protein
MEEVVLGVRRQIQQVHNLGEPGSAHATEPGQRRLVGDDTVADQLVEPDGQDHQTDHTRHPSRQHQAWPAFSQLFAATPALGDVERSVYGETSGRRALQRLGRQPLAGLPRWCGRGCFDAGLRLGGFAGSGSAGGGCGSG